MAAAAPVIGGLYDDFDDNRHEQLLLNDSGSTAGILYFTGDEVYKEYCSEMNLWVSPVATRNEYIQAKRMLESFTADLPDITLVLNFLVNNYSNRIDELLVNYECILYDTKSAKFDFAFYYMVDCFLRTVEENAVAAFVSPAAAAAAAGSGSATPPQQFGGPAQPGPSPATTLSQLSSSGYGSSGGRSAQLSVVGSEPPSPARPMISKALAAAAAAGGSDNEGSRLPAPPSSPVFPQPDPKKPNLLASQIKILTRYLHDLYKGPEELIFDEEITQFHIALLIKYMN